MEDSVRFGILEEQVSRSLLPIRWVSSLSSPVADI